MNEKNNNGVDDEEHGEGEAAGGANGSAANAASRREHLTFTIGAADYAIDLLQVAEIRPWQRPTRIANTPPFIKGLINLHGDIAPVVDMRIKFGCSAAPCTPFTVLIILKLSGRVVGMVVDSVCDVVALADEQLQAPDAASAGVDERFIRGVAVDAGGERRLVVIDIERLMLSADMELVDVQPGEAAPCS